MKHERIAVLRGGLSSEYDISLMTGQNVIEALRSNGYFVKDVIIARNGEWLIDGLVKSVEQALRDIDVVFIALHGEYGEDGTVQRELQRHNMPYTGSSPMPSSIALNKTLTKEQLKELGIKMPKHMRLTRDGLTDPVRTAESITKLFGPHYFIKPERGGSSIGTRLVKAEAELPQAIMQALSDADSILVEEAIHGREATVGVLEDFRSDPLYVFPPIEIIPPTESEFFAADVKYTGVTEEVCPGNFSKQEKDELMKTAASVHRALSLSHYSRSDFIVTNDGVYFLEVNTLPGLAVHSTLPKAVDAVGSSYSELLSHLVRLAVNTRR